MKSLLIFWLLFLAPFQVSTGGFGSSLVISNIMPPAGFVQVPYTFTFTAMGGTQPYSWAVTVGSLPAGLSLNASTGVVTGTPTTANVYEFTIQATDANSKTASLPFSITISGTYSTTSLTANNGSACSGTNLPDSGCNKAFLGLSTANTNTHAQTQLIDPPPVAVSTLPILRYLYSGATTKVYCYYQPWFLNSGSHNGHVNIGMDESDPATISQQAMVMVTRGCGYLVLDWYGTAASQAFNLTVANAWAAYLAANPSVNLKLAIMIDKGALSPFCPTGATDQTTCLTNQLKTFFDYIDANYGPGSGKNIYALDANGNPLVWYFITKSLWSGTNFTGGGGVYPTVQTYAHAHYSKPYQILDEFGSITEAGTDGAYGWIQPPDYVDSTPQSQLGWDDITGGATCNWSTGVCSGTSYLNSLYTACRANPAKHCIGMLWKGFDWTPASWMTNPKIVQQGCANLPLLMAAKISSNGYSSSSQLEGVGVMWNDYEEGTETETGIDNCARPTASISSGTTIEWLTNPTDTTYFSFSTIDHWEIWYGPDTSHLSQGFSPIANVNSFINLVGILPSGSWQACVLMVGEPLVDNRLSNCVAVTIP